jgi:hypothetical protein
MDEAMMLRDAATKLFAADCDWQDIEAMGLPLALLGEEQGGFGLDPVDALAIVRLAGAALVSWPIGETMVANAARAAAGQPLLDGPASADDVPILGGAIVRSLQCAGALGRVLDLTIEHVNTREQFGRPLAKFQAVQHALAQLASEVAAASAAADHAAAAFARPAAEAEIVVGVARVRIGEAVGIANGLAHQMHGAIGFTEEHALHRYTTALWRWRDEFGGHRFWARKVGAAAMAAGPAGYWPMVTAA